MFETLSAAPPDAILGLSEAFKKDANPQKINLSVGVYKDAQGTTPVLETVKQAERKLLETEPTKTYLGIDGMPAFGTAVRKLLFGSGHEAIESGRAITIQAPGGTGALRVAADFLKGMFPTATVWCSTPTWANHRHIFQSAGLDVHSYPYFDAETNGLDFDAMANCLKQIPAGDVICLHACCHNPTGVDPTPDQWATITDILTERSILPLVDFAYQGFGEGMTEDAAGLREICRPGTDVLVASSYSKNFSLYCERVGALTALAADKSAAETVQSQLKRTVRANYSNPPAHGAAIVTTILEDEGLAKQWEAELAEMRNRINGMREAFVAKMGEKCPRKDFSFIARQKGMFSYSGLTPEQVDLLREQHSIYVVRDGRINVGGITNDNIDHLCSAIAAVL